jgi:type I restriction enzyme M protein
LSHGNHAISRGRKSLPSRDAFPSEEFAFMLSNPPYGKSWKKDLESMGGNDKMTPENSIPNELLQTL